MTIDYKHPIVDWIARDALRVLFRALAGLHRIQLHMLLHAVSPLDRVGCPYVCAKGFLQEGMGWNRMTYVF